VLLINKFYITALVTFALAALTDFLDGYIARKLNQESKLGILLDPIADKALVLPLLIFFCLQGCLNIYIISLLIAKDLYVTFNRLSNAGSHGFYEKSDLNGKTKTILLSSLLLISILDSISSFSTNITTYLLNTLLIIVLAISLFSPFDKAIKV